MNKKALIIGANGTVGRSLTDYLLKEKYLVFHINKSKKKIKRNNLKVLNFSLKKKKYILKFLNKYPGIEIYYLASKNLASFKKENFNFFLENLDANVLSLTNCLDAIKSSNKKHKLIYTASSRLYESYKNKKINEKTPYNYNSYYSLTKNLALKIIEFYKKKFNLFISVAILFPNYSKYSNKDFLIPKIIKQIRKGENIEIKNKNFDLDFLDTHSVSIILNKILNLKIPDKFIVSSGKKFTFNKIANAIYINLNVKTKEKVSKNFSKNNSGSNSKIIRKLKIKKNIFNLNSIINNIINND